MSVDNDFDGYWTLQPSTSNASDTPPEPNLDIQIISGVEPLDDEIGADMSKMVPDALFEPLFGQPEPTEAELATAGDDVAKVSPLHTYAILDAAKVVNLPELLAASVLEHRCLFSGDAFEEYKDVAPWLVRLDKDSALTRSLFLKGDAPWNFWDKNPGIFVRARITLDGVWKHARKFTKVQTEAGATVYLRFYESVFWEGADEAGGQTDLLQKLLGEYRVVFRSYEGFSATTFKMIQKAA